MALIPGALTTVEAVSRRLGVNFSDLSTDQAMDIEDYINEVSMYIRRVFLGNANILADDYTEMYRGSDTQELLLRNYPINSITSVTIRSNLDSVNVIDTELVEGENFRIKNADAGILYKTDTWFKFGLSSFVSNKVEFPEENIEVVYNAGFANIPPDLEGVAKNIVADQVKLKDAQGLKSYGVSDVKFTWDKAFNEYQLSVLRSYKRRTVNASGY